MSPHTALTLLAATGLILTSGCATSKPDPNEHFSNWPAGTDPAQIGQRVANNFVVRDFRFQTNPAKAHLGLIYPEACTWYGALTVAELTDDKELTDTLIGKFDPFLTDDGANHINQSAHVDYRLIGIVPLQIGMENKDPRCLKLGLELADAQWATTTSDGITAEARYWIDDMFMIPALQAQAYRATGEQQYLDRAALAMSAYFDRLQQQNGLFYHGTNAPFYWGRGNGWMAAGSTELLRALPEDHPQQAHLLAGYRKMMAALLAHQNADGLWNQLIDDSDSWPETSGSAMFTFAFVTGVKNGWLDAKTYGPAARKAWLALVSHLDEQANVREVCVGTNKGQSKQFYLDRPRAIGDLHAQAPMLWTASALLR